MRFVVKKCAWVLSAASLWATMALAQEMPVRTPALQKGAQASVQVPAWPKAYASGPLPAAHAKPHVRHRKSHGPVGDMSVFAPRESARFLSMAL